LVNRLKGVSSRRLRQQPQHIDQQNPSDQKAARGADRTNGIGYLPAVNSQPSAEEGVRHAL
jgi:hypothetical protein